MKIRSLLLGSAAAAGLATVGYAADLGVVTSLDVCDELGLSGLTISSDENCLVITGGVTFEYSIGDFDPGLLIVAPLNADATNAINDDTVLDSTLDVDAWLQFVATADSDFGPASATIKLLSDDNNGVDDDPDLADTDEWDVQVDTAWVGIGDTTMIMAGKKASVFNDGDDTTLDVLGLYGGDADFSGAAPVTGGVVLQGVHNVGNGLSLGGGVENLMTSGVPAANPTFVGVVAYAGDGFTAHASGAATISGLYKIHAGFTGTFDPIKVVGAISADQSGWWNAVGSLAATFDMFTLAVSGEATSAGEWGASGSVAATVSEGVKLHLAGRYFTGAQTASQIEAGLSAAVTETITLTAAAGYVQTTGAAGNHFYGKAGLAWAPGGGFTASGAAEVNSNGGYKATVKAAKTIK